MMHVHAVTVFQSSITSFRIIDIFCWHIDEKYFWKIQVYIRRISNTFTLRIYFLEQIFEGNNPSTKTVKHELLREVIPLYIRLNVKDSTATYAGLKLELYGCKRKYIIFPVICSAVALSSRIRSSRQQIY